MRARPRDASPFHTAPSTPAHLSEREKLASSKAPSATSHSSLLSATSTAMVPSVEGSSTGCSSAHVNLVWGVRKGVLEFGPVRGA